MITLNTIARELDNLDSILEALEDEDTEENQQIIYNILTERKQTIMERDIKINNICNLISHYDNLTDNRKKEIERLKNITKITENKKRRLKKYLMYYLQATGQKNIETELYKLTVSKNGGKSPLIINEEISLSEIPDKYKIIETKLDKEKIRQDLETKEENDINFAHLGNKDYHLRIK